MRALDLALCALLSLLHPGSAYHYHAVTLLYPRVPVAEGCCLLHTPERWASGAGLLASVPCFDITRVDKPLYLENKECVVRFQAQARGLHPAQWVQCFGRTPQSVRVSVGHLGSAEAHTHLHARVLPLGHLPEVGFALVLQMCTELPIDGWSLRECEDALHTGLWPCFYGPTRFTHSKLALYRKWVL